MSNEDWMMDATIFVLSISVLIVAVSFAVLVVHSVLMP